MTSLALKRRVAQQTADWSATQYLIFEDERTRPSRDLIAQIPLAHAACVVDLGCGPGNSTELLFDRYPSAEVIGIDSSPDMLRQARKRLPDCAFIEADLAAWKPTARTDVLFASGSLQWVPNHLAVLRRLLEGLPSGGMLAVQMPDNANEPALRLMQEVAGRAPWAGKPALRGIVQEALPSPGDYYDLLRPICSELDIWHTVYNHVMDGPEAIVEWFKGSVLRPYFLALDGPKMEREFLFDYTEEVKRAYDTRFDGTMLLQFPRLFIVATR
jgi:trans-aconitate 2-methyltransferase